MCGQRNNSEDGKQERRRPKKSFARKFENCGDENPAAPSWHTAPLDFWL